MRRSTNGNGALPQSVARIPLLAREWIKLRLIKREDCDPSKAASLSELQLEEILNSRQYGEEYAVVMAKLETLAVADLAYGVNPGDRRALYHLVRHLRPRSILEIGTHIGASTASICMALSRLCVEYPAETFRITSVDIVDVNDTISKPWLRVGARYSPRELIRRLGCPEMVEFVVDSSLNMLARSEQTYDLIFLDGDHTAAVNYREISAALRVLNPGGYLLLHDYFPNLQPLWADGAMIAGPAMATRRLRAEGAAIDALPLGNLPWPTKLGSHTTSLAIVGRP